MTELEKLSRKLKDEFEDCDEAFQICVDWLALANYVQRMVLEARIEEREKLMPFIVSSDGGKSGLAELKRQLEGSNK